MFPGAETAADPSTPHRSDTDLQGWSEALHSIAEPSFDTLKSAQKQKTLISKKVLQ